MRSRRAIYDGVQGAPLLGANAQSSNRPCHGLALYSNKLIISSQLRDTTLEILGGLALLTGAFVALVSIPLIFSMLGAMFTVNIKYGFSAVNTIGLTPEGPQLGPPGYEINLLYIAGLVALILGGAGPLSIDALRSRRRQRD